jgi:VWFA-related protein
MTRTSRVFALMFLSVSGVGFAQQILSHSKCSAQVSLSSPTTAEGLIKLDVVVTDKSGKSVSGLEARDFTLMDNDQPQKILSFQALDGVSALPDPPVEVILVVDTVNLSPNEIPLAKSEAERFLRRNSGHLAQPVMLYLLSPDGLSSMLQPSTDGSALAQAIARGGQLPVVRRNHASLLNSDRDNGPSFKTYVMGRPPANPSLTAFGSIVLEERQRPGRKLLFWLSPGWQLGEYSFDDITEFSTRLREARIAVWSWPYPNRDLGYQGFLAPVRSAEKVQLGHLSLEVLAIQSGGGLLDTSTELAAMIGACVDRESVFYTLTFDPPLTNQVDDYHDLKLVTGKPNRTVSTRNGYYDEPVYRDSPSEARRVTVDQLESMLVNAHGNGDKELAQELAAVELTERTNSTQLSSWLASLPGERSRAALVAVADKSVFLASPAAEIPSTAPPDSAARRMMLSRTLDYLSKTIVKLPDFFAIRTTVQYDEPPQKNEQEWKTVTGDQSLHVTETSATTVTFRNGKEIVDEKTSKGKKLSARERELDTQGTFGPILAMVFAGAASARSEFAWSHWEQGVDGPQAIFRYMIPQDVSTFQVGFCCFADPDGTIPFRRTVEYHGEIAIDPPTGTILRLTVDAALEPRLPMLSSGIMVEYGPVEIGGKTYICPTRSVSISRQRTVKIVKEWGESFGVYGRFETILSDVAFGKYHVFRAESRILPDDAPPPKEQ